MRSKRTIKPVKIFDNSVTNSNRNKNNQKNSTNKKRNIISNEMDDLNDVVDVEGGNGAGDSNGGKDDENIGNQNKGGNEENTLKEEVLTCEDDEMVNNKGKESMESENEQNGTDRGGEEKWEKNVDRKKGNNEQKENISSGSTYAKMVTKVMQIVNNKLDFIPTNFNEDGSEIVIFDEDLDTDNEELDILKGGMIVDVFLIKKTQPSCIDVKDWTQDMMQYYKKQLEINKLKNMEDGNEDIEDVLEANSGIDKDLSTKELEAFVLLLILLERRGLWDNLRRFKAITSESPWILMGDFNVTLNLEEHSAGGSKINGDMQEFRDSHSLVVIHLPNTLERKKKSFKFSNFVADKAEFLDVDQFVKHFERFLLNNGGTKHIDNPDTLFLNKLSKNEAEYMVGDITDKEIKEAMFGIGNDKAPGPDGFKGIFLGVHGESKERGCQKLARNIIFAPKSTVGWGLRDLGLEMRLYYIPILRYGKQDCLIWKDQNENKMKFSIRSVWEKFKERKPEISWHKVVWYPQCNPRYAFIVWLAMHKRLATQDRIMAWNKNTNLKCPLCSKESDSHEHLFFKCPYSKGIWRNVTTKMGKRNWDNVWEKVACTIAKGGCKSNIKSVLDRMAFATTIYFVWNERNKRIFTQEQRNCQDLLNGIVESIKMQLMSLKVKKSLDVEEISKEWNISMNIIQ
ncbi:reverse transcriptase zinc-binding domain-containing protein [Tanacetum coccineum]